MNLRYEPLLYRGCFAVHLSLYTYASVMLTYFIKRHKDKKTARET